MAKTKAAGSSRLGRDSRSQRLGIKAYAGEIVRPGMIIIRQRGTKYFAGKNVKRGNDDTLYAMKDGKVKFTQKTKTNYDGNTRKVSVVNVE